MVPWICLKKLITLLLSIFRVFFKTFPVAASAVKQCFLAEGNAMVSIFTVSTLQYRLQLSNSCFRPSDKNWRIFFCPRWFLVSFFLVIAWKIPLPKVPNLTFYEFCLRRPLFWANSTRLYIFVVLYCSYLLSITKM